MNKTPFYVIIGLVGLPITLVSTMLVFVITSNGILAAGVEIMGGIITGVSIYKLLKEYEKEITNPDKQLEKQK